MDLVSPPFCCTKIFKYLDMLLKETAGINMLHFQSRYKIHFQKNQLFTKFISTKTDSSQNSFPQKQTLHKIHFQKTDSLQNSIPEKQTLHKIQYQKRESSENSIYRHKSFYHFLGIPNFFFLF